MHQIVSLPSPKYFEGDPCIRATRIPSLEHLHCPLQACLQLGVLILKAANAPVERFGSPCTAEACDIVFQKPVGIILLPRDPLDIEPDVLCHNQVFNGYLLPEERRMAGLLVFRQMPDYNLAVGPNPRMRMFRQVLKGKDDCIELGLVIGRSPFIGEKNLLPREQSNRMAVPAPVHHNFDPFLHPFITMPRKNQNSRDPGDFFFLEKRGQGARGDHRIIRDLPLVPVLLQPVLSLRRL